VASFCSRLSLLLSPFPLAAAASRHPTASSVEDDRKRAGKAARRARRPFGAPKLRAEAAIAMVDIGRAEEVDTVLAALPADDKAEIAKTLVPGTRRR
jgi:hypothetical protein